MISFPGSNAAGVVAAMILVVCAVDARAQVSCAPTSISLNTGLPGGGAMATTGASPPVLEAPGSAVVLAVTCEGGGQFPPPVIAGATYGWSTGATEQRIQVTAPASGQSATYSVTVGSPNGTRTLQTTLTGAQPGAPSCRILTNAPQPLAVGTIFQVAAACSPEPSVVRWDVRAFLGALSFADGNGGNGSPALVHVDSAQPGDVFPVYLQASNAAGAGPNASLLVTIGNPNAQLPLNPALLAAGGQHTCALTTAGGVRCWGDNAKGQLAEGEAILYSTTPGSALGLATGVTSIVSGFGHGCALRTSGGVVCWGENAQGQLGDGTTTPSFSAVGVVGLSSGVASLSASASGGHTCALTSTGSVKCWGRNGDGQLGSVFVSESAKPIDIAGLPAGILAIASGGNHTCALTPARGVKCWGRNTQGQLGNGTFVSSAAPVDVVGLTVPVVSLAAGFAHTCATLSGGNVKCWGWNGEGELGAGGTATSSATPVDVAQIAGVSALAAGGNHTCAVVNSRELWCWGRNTEGELGDGTLTDRAVPAPVKGLPQGVRAVSGGGFHTCAVVAGGGVFCWGQNGSGRLGDGTTAWRTVPQIVLGVRGAGFLDLTLEDPFQPTDDQVPVFPAVATATATSVDVAIEYRSQDVGTIGSVYVFALAPAGALKRAAAAPDLPLRLNATGGPKDAPVSCILAQLTSTGQLQQVSASSLQPYITGVLSAQGVSVQLLNNASATQNGGATFYVGYGTDANAMLSSGTNRSVVSVPGQVTCQPQPPQTGWWWNPSEGGRGYSIEARGHNLFYASFLYDSTGRATWYVASGPTSLDGSIFTGRLTSVSGGQSLSGPYRLPDRLADLGPITLAFNDASHGTMIWPGGSVPIQREAFVPGGLALAPLTNQPESGWWWNPEESGRGFFMEWQGPWLNIAGYMYDDDGNPTWYIAVYSAADPTRFDGAWWQFANGQTLTGTYKPATRVSDHVAPVSIRFDRADTAVMTLPGGLTTRLVRQRF